MHAFICVLPPFLFVSFLRLSLENNPCLSDSIAFDLSTRKQTRIRPPSYSCLEMPRIRQAMKSLRHRDFMGASTLQKSGRKSAVFVV